MHNVVAIYIERTLKYGKLRTGTPELFHKWLTKLAQYMFQQDQTMIQAKDLPSDLFPRDIESFLDEAVERLILRKVSNRYIFIHRLLLDYFAELED
ncbi:hypothetical protein [Dictyobacter kobayashii]|uniref:Core-binding (CB) domain-containing protein n=1 Tax=Dictyobacter kobayashii TaxID=2014872 RepID=A0A402ACE1_9CHLR|nr:hypothetical protein [Dictyobacter kobayashii]GCE16763.1 hypothetical protein KDK_05630 [Dictyobacter kobayashii]